MAGSISLLVDSPLRDLAFTMREVPTEVKRQIGKATKQAARPIWFQEVREHAHTRIQQRVLVNSADVSATARNVTLMSGAKGTLSSGTPVRTLVRSTEFGMNPGKRIAQKSAKGTTYERRAGNAFGPNRRGGYVVYPAVSDSLPRFASLWVQTTRRTVHESLEKV